MFGCKAPVLPTLIKFFTPTFEASLTTMAMQAGPIPLESAETRAPW
jgi:hypothetical protein